MIKRRFGSWEKLPGPYLGGDMQKFIKGKVLAYSDAVNAGNIVDEKGQIYLFARKDWKLAQAPEVGREVVFVLESDRARSITEEIPD